MLAVSEVPAQATQIRRHPNSQKIAPAISGTNQSWGT